MRVLVVVVSYNFMPWAERCLGSVIASAGKLCNAASAADNGLMVDALVVDNGSTDGSVAYIREHFPSVRIIENSGNLGFGAANNIGLRIACSEGYDFAYLLNQDAWLHQDTLSLLIAASSEDCPLLSPVQLTADGQLDANFRRKCARYLKKAGVLRGNDVCDDASMSISPVNENPDCRPTGHTPRRIEVPFVMAAHWLLKTSTIRTVGGFSPAFSQYGEDDNYIHRLRYFGMRCAVVPAAKAVHDRALRPASKERLLRLKCISSVVRLSNPCRPFAVSAVLEPLRLLSTAAKNLSFYPLRYLPELLSRYGELRSLRKSSKQREAFLETQQ